MCIAIGESFKQYWSALGCNSQWMSRPSTRPQNTLKLYFDPNPRLEARMEEPTTASSLTRTTSSSRKRQPKAQKALKDEIVKTFKTNTLVTPDFVRQIQENCPPLSAFLNEIQRVSKVPANHLLQKFLKSDQCKPWCDKYAPKEVDQLIDKTAALKVEKWMWVFNSSRALGELDLEDSFIVDDNSVSARRQDIRTVMIQQKWRAKALILQGPEGIGKYSTIKCLANTNKLHLNECSNYKSRMNYFKQYYQSTKSHCLKSHQRPTSNAPGSSVFRNLGAGQTYSNGNPKRFHLIHQVTHIYNEQASKPTQKPNPNEKGKSSEKPKFNEKSNQKTRPNETPDQKSCQRDVKSRFYQTLEKFVKHSEVPVVLTTCGTIPQQLTDYDVIRMDQPSIPDLSRCVWAIVHIEHYLQPRYKNQVIKQDDLELKINQYFQEVEFKELVTVRQVQYILGRMQRRVDSVLAFFQQYMFHNPKMEFESVVAHVDRNRRDELNQFTLSGGAISRELSLMADSEDNRFIHPQTPSQTLSQILMNLEHMTVRDVFTNSGNNLEEHFEGLPPTLDQLPLKLMLPMSKHRSMMRHICFRIQNAQASQKLSCSLRPSELSMLAVFDDRSERRLRSFQAQPVLVDSILKRYLDAQNVQYVLQTLRRN